MFNLANLNDYEFELLCKDIMKEKLQIRLQTYTKGPDGGVDICDGKKNPKVVIQAKHYCGSRYSNLFSALKKEVPKVREIVPLRYYVCTSLQMTKHQKDEVYKLFQDYMHDLSHIVDGIEINEFLSEERNSDIVKKHYKLWLCSTHVLELLNNANVFIDCEELICDIEKEIPLFVETTAYFEAKRKLWTDSIVILIGAPGVGKSTISKMLLMSFAEDGYAVRYTTDNDISSIKRTLSTDPNKKEIILLDDFLGQHYLKIRDTQPNELRSLISYVTKNPNKKVILNSRITILNEAAQSYIQFHAFMEEHKKNQYVINLDKMPLLEKAQILYNHLYFSCLPSDFFLNIKQNKRYIEIIRHKNYNPRIIEYVTRYINRENVVANNYFSYIWSKLENPEDVWRDEFRNRLAENDRILMNTLYSLTDTAIDIDVLENAFNKRICQNEHKETTLYAFKNTIQRLVNSLVKLTEERGKVKVSVVNPSINDYLREELRPNINEHISIIESAVYAEQVFKMPHSSERDALLAQLINSGAMLKLRCLYNSPFFYFIKAIIYRSIFDGSLKENVRMSFERLYENVISATEYSDLLYRTMDKKFVETYHLLDSLQNSNVMFYLIRPIDFSNMRRITDRYIEVMGEEHESTTEYTEVLDMFREAIVDKLSDVACEMIEDNLFEMASEKLDHFQDEFGQVDEANLESSMQDEAENQLNDYIEEELGNFSTELGITIDQFSINSIMENLDFSGAIDSVYKDSRYDPDYESRVPGRSDLDEIIMMFER